MGQVITVNRDSGRQVVDRRIGRFRVVDDFLAVVDGRGANLRRAMEQARNIMKLCPEFRSVSIVRERSEKQIKQSLQRVKHYFDQDAFGHLAHSGSVFPNAAYGLPWKCDRSMSTLIAHKPIILPSLAISHDFGAVFSTAKHTFPEFLSWDIRTRPGNPGGRHVDEQYRPGLNHISNLPERFIRRANKQIFEPLPGSVTLSCALHHGSTIVTNKTEHASINFYDDPECVGYDNALGDVGVYRACGWPDHNFLPAQHCEPSRSFQRVVAIASSNGSYLHPQIREHMGWDRLPSQTMVENLAQILEHCPASTPVDTLISEIKQFEPSVTKYVPISILERYDDARKQALLQALQPT